MKLYLLEFAEHHETVSSLGIYSEVGKAQQAANDYAKSHYACHDIDWNNQYPDEYISDGLTYDRVFDQQIFFTIRKLTVDGVPLRSWETKKPE